MELIAITQARIAAMIQLHEWDPFGKALTLEALGTLGKRYSFAKVPTKLEDVDFQRGVELQEGRHREIRVDRIVIFLNAIVVDTRSSTEDSQVILNDLLELSRGTFGSGLKPARQTFASQLVFRSEMQLAKMNPILSRMAGVLSERTSSDLRHPFTVEPTAILLHVDTAQARTTPATFSIERRNEIPFAEKTYFSSAPLRTVEHVKLVEEFEAALLGCE